MAEKSDVNDDADSDGAFPGPLVDDTTLVVDGAFAELDEDPQAASATAVLATSDTTPARLPDNLWRKRIRRVM
jgi:hypothetical protein